VAWWRIASLLYFYWNGFSNKKKMAERYEEVDEFHGESGACSSRFDGRLSMP